MYLKLYIYLNFNLKYSIERFNLNKQKVFGMHNKF